MKSELIVDVQASEVSSALLEDSRLVSLQKEARNIAYARSEERRVGKECL